MKPILIIQIVIMFLGAVCIYLIDRSANKSLSFFFGAAIILINLIFQSYIWRRLFDKKLIALPTMGIVLKYAFLAGIFGFLGRFEYFKTEWVLIGLSTLPITAIMVILRKQHWSFSSKLN